LASLGKIAGEELVREQLRQLRELHKCRTEPAEDRLAIAAHLARALWTCEKQDDAIDILDAALTEYRQTMNGVLPASANNAIESYVAYLEGRQRFTRGESWLQAELGRPANQQQQYWLVRRLLTLYVNTVQAKAEVTMGADAALCRATYAKMVPELDRPDRNHRRAVLSLACNLFEAAKRTVIESPEAREFAFTVCPAVLARETEPSTYRNQVTQVGRMLKTVLGPLTSLEFLVERLEREPQWLSLNRNYPGWQTYAYELGRCREDARPTGTIETRLLNVVTAELRRDLTERRELNRCIYARHNNYFWSEKAAEFKSVAEAVWREQKASGATVLHIANYLWNGLEEYDRVIEMLAEAHGNQLLDEQGQSILVSYLHARNRFAESIPILPGLIEQRPDTMNYRTQLMAAYFKVQDGDKLRKTLTEADRHFHEGGRWQEGNIAGLAYACVKAALNEESVKYYEELIPLRKRNLGGRIVGDCALPEYYRQLANAQIGLGRTVEAVEAASGSTVMWSQDQYTRNNAMNVLQDVLRRSPDLAGYVTNLEKQVAENNMENPIVRKALGRVFLEKNDTKEAIRHLSLAMDVQPNDRETCDAIVSAYDRMNDKPGAIRQILTTVDLSRRDIALYAELGRRYLADGDSTESERAYLSIAEMLPNESESHTMLAEIRQQQNRWDKAIHHWRQVVRVRSLEPTGFQRLANALIHQKQWKEAIENIDILAKREWPQRFGNVRAMAEQLRRQVPVK
jgi:tetratricopeptide (TPR) repeat protein